MTQLRQTDGFPPEVRRLLINSKLDPEAVEWVELERDAVGNLYIKDLRRYESDRLVDAEGYGAGENPRFNMEFGLSAEDTAKWLAGEEVPWTKNAPPDLRRRLDWQKQHIRQALTQMSGSLGGLSPDTELRMRELLEAAPNDRRAALLLAVMVARLIEFAYSNE